MAWIRSLAAVFACSLVLAQEPAPPGPGHVEGIVLDAMGRTLADAEVWLANLAAPHARTDENGAFVVDAVAAPGGSFRLTSLDPVWVFDQPKEDDVDMLRYRRQFVGRVPDDSRCEIRCAPATEVRGRVVDHDGRGVPGASVQLMADCRDGRTVDIAWTDTDRDGMFVLPRLNGVERREVWLQVHSRAGDVRGERFQLGLGEAIQLPELHVRPAAVITGIVRDGVGNPLGGVTVRLWRLDGGGADQTISDREGRYRVVAGSGT